MKFEIYLPVRNEEIDLKNTINSILSAANKLAQNFGYNLENYFHVYDGEVIPFEQDFFDFTISSFLFGKLFVGTK